MIYQIKCKECQASYIGKTERILFHYAEKHLSKYDTAIHKHHLATWLFIGLDKVKIKDRTDSYFKLQFKEISYVCPLFNTIMILDVMYVSHRMWLDSAALRVIDSNQK